MATASIHSAFVTIFVCLIVPFVTSMGYLDIEDLKNSQFDISIQSKPVLLHRSHSSPETSSEKSPEQSPEKSPQQSPEKSSDISGTDSLTDGDKEGGEKGYSPTANDVEDANSILLSSKYGQLYQCSLPMDPVEADLPPSQDDSSSESVVKLLAPLKDGPCLFYTKGWWSYEFCYGREVKQYHFESGAIQGETISLGKFESDYDWERTAEWEASSKTLTKKRKHHSQYYVDGSVCDLTGDPRKTEVRFKCDDSLKGTDREVITEIEEPSSCTYLFTVSTIRLCSHPRFRQEKVKKAASISCSPALSKKEFEKYTKLQETTAKRVKEMGERLRNLNAKYAEKLEMKRKEKRDTVTQDLQEKKATSTKLSPTMEKFFKEVYSPKKLKKDSDVSGENINDGEESADMKAFKEEAKTLSTKEAASAKQTMASVLKGQFEEIYEEAKDELSKETGQNFNDESSDTEKAALETLTKTLNKLLDQLDKTEKQLDATGKDLKESVEEKQDKWWRRHYESAQMEKNKAEGKMKKDEEDKLSKWIKDTIDKDESKEAATSSTDNLVKVRISKLSKSADRKGSQPISIDAKDEKKLSKAVQEELEKAGLLDTQGRQVEVRIVTTGFFEDEDDDGVHTLSQGDSTQFRTLLSSLLGANSQQITEEYRKSQMKSNYKFVWTGDKLEEEETKEKSPPKT